MKRVLILALPLALALVACGDDDDTPDGTTADVSTPDVTTPDLTAPEISLPDISLPDITLPDISIPDLSDISIPDFSIPDFSVPENAADMLGQVFPKLDEKQINCLVDAAEKAGAEASDPSQILSLIGDCDIALTDLNPGG